MFFKNKHDQPGRQPRRSLAQQRTAADNRNLPPAGVGRLDALRVSRPAARRQEPVRTDGRSVSTQQRNQVYSYRASRSQRQETLGRVSPEQAEATKAWKERLAWLRSAPRIAALLAIIVFVGILLRLDTQATVVPMDDTKGQVFLRSLHTYEASVQKLFSASWLNGNKITVDTQRISQDIRRQFPELKTVAISLPIAGSKPVVYVQPAVPALILATKAHGTFVIDTDGRALLTGNQVPDLAKLKLPVISDESGVPVSAGNVALTSTSVAFISEVVGQLKAKQIPIQSLALPPAVSELRVRIASKPYYIKFNLHGTAREEVGAYLAIKQELESKGKTPGQYIDVRVPGRVYYK